MNLHVLFCLTLQKFFRRGLTEFQGYACKDGGNCVINPRTRNQCRACRYTACITAGMSREGRCIRLLYNMYV